MRPFLLWLILLLGAVSWLTTADARPGGGHSSSSASSSSPSGGGSSFSFGNHSNGYYAGGGNNYYGNEHPMSSLTVLIVFIVLVIVIIAIVKNQNSKPAFTARPTFINRDNQRSSIQQQLALLKQQDANFSGILFLEFVHSLYNKFYSYSTHPEFSYLSPFLSSDLQQHFQQASAWTINEVVINGIRWLEIITDAGESDSISVDIDANYTLLQQGKRSRYAVEERWQFFRQKGVLSAEPKKMQTLCCPHCGAPAHFTDAGVCDHCGSAVQKGGMQWYLGKRVVLKTVALEITDLVAYAEEQGTDFPTLKAKDLIEQIKLFQEQYAIADWNQFWQPFVNDIVKTYFLNIYEQWSKRNWQAVRHLLSDRLYEANTFWMNLYAEHNWFNRLDNLTIQQIELVKIEQDKFYEAITVRIYAACNDYTEDANGKRIGGSKRDLRRYSEYWTLVRRAGIGKHTAPYSLSQCPQCGAPADNMGQTGECGYCGSKISTGEFSWVLFLITQDEVYDG